MAYAYNINNQKKDRLSSNCLFTCHTLGAVISIFVSTFLVAYIYQFSANTFEYIKNVGFYQISVYGTFLLTYWFFSYLTDRTNRVWIYRLAQVIRLVFVIVIIFYGKQLAHLLPLAGFIYGLSEACYYGSYNVLKQEMVSRKSMSKFSVLTAISSKGMEIIIPVTLGALIQISTYEQTSIYVAAILGLIIILTFFIRAQKPNGSNFDLKGYIKKLKVKNEPNRKIKFVYKATLVYGLTTITSNLLTICIMLQFHKTLSLGSITSIIGAIAIIEIMLVTRFTKASKRDWLYIIVILLPLFSSMLFAIYPSIYTVIVYNLLMAVSKIIFSAIYDIYRNSTLKESGLYSEIAEHQTVVESLMTVTRVLSYAVLILVGLLKNLIVFKILLVVFSLSYSGVNFSLMLYERKFLRVSADGTIARTPKEEEQQFNKIIAKLKKDW